MTRKIDDFSECINKVFKNTFFWLVRGNEINLFHENYEKIKTVFSKLCLLYYIL